MLHVWLVQISNSSRWCLEPLRSCLSIDEQLRLDAFRLVDDRVRFAASHALVRVALSQLYPVAVQDWIFGRTNLGKPFLIGPEGAESVHFSLSRTRGLVGCTVAHVPVGLDLELIDHHLELDELVPYTMALQEITEWMVCPAEDRMRRLLSLWTLKEALSKALGVGMQVPFRKLVMELGASGSTKLIDMPRSLGDPSRWNLRLLEAGDTHVGALADSGPVNADQFSIKWLQLEMLVQAPR